MATETVRHAGDCFYDGGLCFECTRCGACCTGAHGTIYVAPREIEAICSLLGISRREFLERYCYPFRDSYSIGERPNGDCFFLTDGGCGIYEARPAQCRTWPFWPENLSSKAAWDWAGRRCPGIGRGRLYSKGEIGEILERQPH